MHRYNVSNFSKTVHICALLFLAIGLSISISFLIFVEWESALPMIMGGALPSLLIIWGIYDVIRVIRTDAIFGKFSYNRSGITLFVGSKEYHHKWSDFQYADIIPVSVDSVGSKTYANLYVVYFSTRYLTFEEKKSFMSIGRKNLNCIAWFQYRPELISEIIQYLPSQLADSLRAKHMEVQENMNGLERLYNKS